MIISPFNLWLLDLERTFKMSTYDENIKILSKLDCNIKFAVVGANEAILCDRIKILEKMLKNKLCTEVTELLNEI